MSAMKWLVFLALAVAAVPAAAQVEEKKISFNVGGGYTFALSDVRDHLGDGFNVAVGVIFKVSPTFSLQIEYGHIGLGKKQIDIPVAPTPGGSTVNQPFFGAMDMQFVNANAILRPKPGGRASPYIIAGVGYYFRSVEVTTPATGYILGHCRPSWNMCYQPQWLPVDQIVGSHGTSDAGADIGGGVSVRLGATASIYFEARYHYVLGLVASGSSAQAASGQFLPFTVGIRF
jgi:opacity protein-like surface antigen